MKRILFAFVLMVAGATHANAQLASAIKVTACAGQSLSLGGAAPLTMDLTGDLCTNAASGGASNVTIVAPLGTQTLAASVATTACDGCVVTLGALADTANITAGHTAMSAFRQIDADLLGPPNVNVSSTPTPLTGATASSHTGMDINYQLVGGATAATGAGAAGSTMPRMTVSQDATTIAGAPPGRTYNTVAASQTSYVLSSTQGGASGATGDYLSHCVIVPGTTSPGNVIIYDNSTAIYTFAGGASSVATLISWAVPVGAVSISGAWKVTTGANVTAFCSGKFT